MSVRAPLAVPDDAAVERALRAFACGVRQLYGLRLKGVYLLGSRARGDHTAESDADVAVILDDGSWDYWTERSRLAGLTYEFLVGTGADIQAWPAAQREWSEPRFHANPSLVTEMRRDARPILEVA